MQEQLGRTGGSARVRILVKRNRDVTSGENRAANSPFGGVLRCVNLLISVEDARPFAPHMSFGSRATQAKPEARTSCSERPDKTASFSAGERESAPARAHLGHQRFFARGEDCALVREPVLKLDRAGEQEPFWP